MAGPIIVITIYNFRMFKIHSIINEVQDMKIVINTQNQKIISLITFSTLLLISFQNCSQKGAINVSSAVDTNTTLSNEVTPTVEEPIKYSDFKKSFIVNSNNNLVDTLIVIDNSGSMNYEQLNMAHRFENFIDKLSGLNWQLGIITTDTRTDSINAELKDGRLLLFSGLNKHYITSQDDLASVKIAFAGTIQRKANEGSGNEQGILATYRAIERALDSSTTSNPNIGFIRPEATLAVIVVTDADETGKLTSKSLPENLIQLVQTKYPEKNFKFNSIIVKPNDINCKNNKTVYTNSLNVLATNSNETYGTRYSQLSELTAGIVGDICAEDYGDQLSQIGQSTYDQIKEFTLDCSPIDSNQDGQMDVTVTDSINQKILTNYIVEKNRIQFDSLLPFSTYSVSYKCIK